MPKHTDRKLFTNLEQAQSPLCPLCRRFFMQGDRGEGLAAALATILRMLLTNCTR